MRKSKTYIAIPPGTTIKEQLLDRGMKQKEFAVRMGMSEKHISKLINGEVQLTIEMARKLEMVLGVPTQFWCNLEAVYREDLAKVKEENTMGEDLAIAENMPYEKMAEKCALSSKFLSNVVRKTSVPSIDSLEKMCTAFKRTPNELLRISADINYRIPMQVTAIRCFKLGIGFVSFPVCPQCKTTLEREYQTYCDRCGQRLDWNSLDKADIIYSPK